MQIIGPHVNTTRVKVFSLLLLVSYANYTVIGLEEFSKLRDLLEDFRPVLSRIDSNVDKVNRNVDKIDRNVDKLYKDIEGAYVGNATYGMELHILIVIPTSRTKEDYYPPVVFHCPISKPP